MNTSPIQVESRKNRDGHTTVAIIGEVDLATSPWVAQELARHDGKVIVDLRQVPFMDSTGLEVLLTQLTRLHESGGHLRLIINSSRLKRLLDLTGLTDVFEVADTI